MNRHGHSLDPIELARPYCGKGVHGASGASVYPHRGDLHHKRFYLCAPCGAWVGVHEGTWEPLGRLANAALRKAKQAAHAEFDPLWKMNGSGLNRGRAYKWLAASLGIEVHECHIGMFDEAMCRQVVVICRERRIRQQQGKE